MWVPVLAAKKGSDLSVWVVAESGWGGRIRKKTEVLSLKSQGMEEA